MGHYDCITNFLMVRQKASPRLLTVHAHLYDVMLSCIGIIQNILFSIIKFSICAVLNCNNVSRRIAELIFYIKLHNNIFAKYLET